MPQLDLFPCSHGQHASTVTYGPWCDDGDDDSAINRAVYCAICGVQTVEESWSREAGLQAMASEGHQRPETHGP